jgi:hypothetical protein
MGARLQGISLQGALAAVAAALVALLPVGAAAQIPMGLSLGHNDKPALTPEQLEKQRALDKAYKAAKEKIPEKNAAAADPWGGIRPAAGPSANAKKNKP